jgi:hypothetical protein
MRTPLALFSLLAACGSDYELNPEPVDVDPGDVTECEFSPTESSGFYEYDCNPVFTTTGEEWAQSIGSTTFTVAPVLGHAMYQLWYAGVGGDDDFGDYGLGYAISDNGTDWEPHPANPLLMESGDSAWDGSNMDALQVVWDPEAEKYVMIYQGYNLELNTWGLGVAESEDGQSWRRVSDDPVMDFASSSGEQRWCWPLGLTLSPSGDGGYQGYIAGSSSGSDKCEVYGIQAYSESSWHPDTAPTLPVSEDGAWDDTGVISVAVAELDGEWYMFYVGFGEWEEHPGETYVTSKHQYLGWARSTDGLHWEKEAEPIPIHKDTLSGTGEVGSVAAVAVGSRIHLWVTDTYTLEGQGEVGGVGYFLFDPSRQDDGSEDE